MHSCKKKGKKSNFFDTKKHHRTFTQSSWSTPTFSWGGGHAQQETPIGIVIEGMENAQNFFSYGDIPPWGKGPVQHKISPEGGEAYMSENFPKADRFGHCKVQKTGNPILKPKSNVVEKSLQTAEERLADEQVFEQQQKLRGGGGGSGGATMKKHALHDPRAKMAHDATVGLETSAGSQTTLVLLVGVGFLFLVAILIMKNRKKAPNKSV
jgi:hypothetical protein